MSKHENTTDPFSRQKTIKATRNAYSGTDSIGEASNIADTLEQETQKLSPFIPTQASTEEGMAKLMHMMRSEADATYPSPTKSVFENPYIVAEPEEAPVMEAFKGPSIPTPEPIVTKESDPEPEKDEDKPEFTDEEVLPILDALLTSGCAKLHTSIRGIPLTLRTQYFWEDQMVVQMADKKAGPDTNLRITGAVYYDMYALAANLEMFGGARFPALAQGTPEELQKSFEARVNYLQTLPSALITVISMKRLEFLRKVNFVISNFDRLIEVF